MKRRGRSCGKATKSRSLAGNKPRGSVGPMTVRRAFPPLLICKGKSTFSPANWHRCERPGSSRDIARRSLPYWFKASRLPSAAPDHGRAAAADFFFLRNLGGGAAAAGLVGDGATGSTATTAGSRQHDDGLRTCARSKISVRRDGALYLLAGGCRAPRRIMAAPPRPIFFFAKLGGGAAAAGLVGDGATGSTATTAGLAGAAPLSTLEDRSALNLHRKGVRDNHGCASRAAQLRGRRRRPPDRASMMMAFGRVRAPRFRSGGMVLFIP